MKFKKVLPIFFLLFILLPYPSPSEPFETGMGRGMGMRQWRKEARCWGTSELSLSFDQKKSLILIQQTFYQDTQGLRAQLFTRRLELRELLTDPLTKIESIRSKYLEMNDAQSRLEEKTIEYLIRVRNLLTQEQLKVWCPEQEFPHFQRMMHGTGPMGP